MKSILFAPLTAVSVACAFFPAAAQDTPAPDRQPPTTTDTDRDKEKATKDKAHEKTEAPANEKEFVTKAAKGGAAEVKMAQIATEQASDAKVKEFAQQLVKDHAAANQELKTVAEGLKITLPDETAAKQDSKCEELKKKTGAAFDKAFLKEMGHCHAKDIALFEAGRKVAKSSEVTAFIDKTLPVIKSHARTIDALLPDYQSTSPTVSPGKNAPEVPRRGETPGDGTSRPDTANPDNK